MTGWKFNSRCSYFVFAAAMLCTLLPQSTVAEETDEDRAATHFAAGSKLYNEGKFEEAIKELQQAYALRPATPILLNIGRTYEKLGNKTQALEFYQKFLQTARLGDPNRAEVEKVVAQLKLETTSGQPPVASGEGTDATAQDESTAGRQQLIHTPVDAARVRKEITVSAELPPDVDAENTVMTLFFRKVGETAFHKVAMSKQGDSYVGIIPAREVTSTSLQYYIEAADASDNKKVLATSASQYTPNIVVIEGGLAPGEKATELRSPYRTWMWISAGVTGALLGTSILTTILSAQRASTMEDAAAGANGVKRPFTESAASVESEGKLLNALSIAFFTTGLVAGGVTGYLWYKDRNYLREHQEVFGQIQLNPWIGRQSAGLSTTVSF